MHIASKISDKAQTFQEHYPWLGPAVWIASIQYFITMLVSALYWPVRYSALHNTISDLGNTVCGTYGVRYVCSPLYTWMNLSFILLGLTMTIGSALIYQEFKKTTGSWIGFSMMALAGIGTILVGAFPENTVSAMHVMGAILALGVGNVGLLVLGLSLELPRRMRIYTILSGVIALSAFFLFAAHIYLGLGIGGMERLAGHTQTLWLIIFGFYLTRDHYRSDNR